MEGSTFLWTPILIILVEILLGGFIAKTLFNFGQYYWKTFLESQTHPKKKKHKKKPHKKRYSSEEEEEEEVYEEDEYIEEDGPYEDESYSE